MNIVIFVNNIFFYVLFLFIFHKFCDVIIANDMLSKEGWNREMSKK